MPPVGTALRAEIDAAGIVLTPLAEVDGVRLIASLAVDGRGPAILPATAAPNPGEIGAWRKIKIAGLPRRRVGIATRRRGLLAAPARAVVEVLRDIVGDASDPEGLYPPSR
jgi:DNA-binding transcriptional LysR family regulator